MFDRRRTVTMKIVEPGSVAVDSGHDYVVRRFTETRKMETGDVRQDVSCHSY